MAIVQCAISGLELDIPYFPGRLEIEGYYHPTFLIPRKRLLGYLPRYTRDFKSQPPIDSYLYFLALLNSTSLLRWYTPASFTKNTQSIVAKNLEKLVFIIGRIDIIKHPTFQLPQISINRDTCELENVGAWLANWENAINSFLTGNREIQKSEQLIRRENALKKLLYSKQTEPLEKFASRIAEWACIAADFPRTLIQLENKRISCAEYWIYIIRICASEKIVSIPRADIEELQDHIIQNIDKGTIYSDALYNLINSGLTKAIRYQTLGLIYGHDKSLEDIGAKPTLKLTVRKSTFEIIEAETSVQEANILSILQTAPTLEPKLENYPSKFEWLKAKTAWIVLRESAKL